MCKNHFIDFSLTLRNLANGLVWVLCSVFQVKAMLPVLDQSLCMVTIQYNMPVPSSNKGLVHIDLCFDFISDVHVNCVTILCWKHQWVTAECLEACHKCKYKIMLHNCQPVKSGNILKKKKKDLFWQVYCSLSYWVALNFYWMGYSWSTLYFLLYCRFSLATRSIGSSSWKTSYRH